MKKSELTGDLQPISRCYKKSGQDNHTGNYTQTKQQEFKKYFKNKNGLIYVEKRLFQNSDEKEPKDS